MWYILYKIINSLDGKIYIGTHKTKNINDEYFGSGKYLKLAITKYGIEVFKKKILFVFDNSHDMFAKEAELVTEEFIKREDTYNLVVGGRGGFEFINENKLTLNSFETGIRAHQAYMTKYMQNESFREYMKQISSGRMKLLHKEGKITYDTFTNRHHIEETKRKISKSRKGKFTGAENSNAKKVIDDKGNIFNTVNECAAFYKVDAETIRRWTKKGKFNIIRESNI